MPNQMRPPQAGQSCIRGPIALTAPSTCPSCADVDTHFLGVRATAEQTVGTREVGHGEVFDFTDSPLWVGSRWERRVDGDIPPAVNSPGQLAPQPRSHNLSIMLCIFITKSSPPLVQTRLQRACQKIFFKYQSLRKKNRLSTLNCPLQKQARHAAALFRWKTSLGRRKGDLLRLNCSAGVLQFGQNGTTPLERCGCRGSACGGCSSSHLRHLEFAGPEGSVLFQFP